MVGAYKNGSVDKVYCRRASALTLQLKVQDLKDYAKFNSMSTLFRILLIDSEISISGKTKKSDIMDALREHLEKETGGKKKK